MFSSFKWFTYYGRYQKSQKVHVAITHLAIRIHPQVTHHVVAIEKVDE